MHSGLRDIEWYGPNVDYKGGIHAVFAGLFYQCMLVFNGAIVLVFNFRYNALLRYSFYFKVVVLVIGGIAMGLCVPGVIYSNLIVDPFEQRDMFHFVCNLIGLLQYTVTMSLCLFPVSFALDYYAIQKESLKKE